jgi:hypothetical protein
MAEQMENPNAGLEANDQVEDDYEGDLGDGARTKGSSAGIIGLDASS